MKKLFIVAAKLIGLLALYWAIATLVQIGFAIPLVLNPVPDIAGGSQNAGSAWWLAGTVLYGVITLVFSLLLMFRTESIATRLNVPDQEISGIPDDLRILKGGIILLGLYFFLFSIPSLTKTISTSAYYRYTWRDFRYMSQLVSGLLQLGLAVFVMKKPDVVLNMLGRKLQASN
jgi:hypothetical protein